MPEQASLEEKACTLTCAQVEELFRSPAPPTIAFAAARIVPTASASARLLLKETHELTCDMAAL
ncbi:MAG: hypothetical protein JRN57_01870 [Nitrososphaerota archaeon]|nr:hypothetical protein [Nitrososphaerota archaeon]